MSLISLEFNELNFDFLAFYVGRGRLPHFARLMDRYQLFETEAEKAYPHLEPWIQWPTVYTGKTFAEHGLFRLGDGATAPHTQIWELLEAEGCRVGAVSPMNAGNRCRDPAFFLPDPWTQTAVSADARTEELFGLIRQLVNDNASAGQSTLDLARRVLPLALPYLSPGSLPRYFAILPMALRHRWARAAFLDTLLADMFLALRRRHRPDYASLFLNAAAHIQHHHMYDSAAYQGERRNPEWYSSAAATGADPLLFIYQAYDRILGRILAENDARVMITTGLSQVPNESDLFQYRIADFSRFFGEVGLGGARVEPRMSRDFLLAFESETAARAGAERLDRITCGGKPLFRVEDRGDSLFCQVAYFGPPEGLDRIEIDGAAAACRDHFVLVSIENAIHRSTGFHLDTAEPREGDARRIPLAQVHERLVTAALDEAGLARRRAA